MKSKSTRAKDLLEPLIRKVEIEEFLKNHLQDAGFQGISMTTVGGKDVVIIHALKPSLVAGPAQTRIMALEEEVRKKFGEDIRLSVAGIEVPELDPQIMANRIASALERGIHFRRVAHWALDTIMKAGALGAEIKIIGKLRTERATREAYRAGYLIKAGELYSRFLKEGSAEVLLKPGVYGIKVRILTKDVLKFLKDVNEETLQKLLTRR